MKRHQTIPFLVRLKKSIGSGARGRLSGHMALETQKEPTSTNGLVLYLPIRPRHRSS